MTTQNLRIPFPADECAKRNINEEKWNVLINDTFANVKFSNSILTAFDIAKVKGLDVFAGHLAIISQKKKVDNNWVDVEVAWLTLKSQVYTAHRTGSFAGLDPVVFGPTVKKTYNGRAYKDGRWEDRSVNLEFPEYATATVYRIVDGVRCPFSETVFFSEVVSISHGLPTMVWATKPRLMLGKTAKAAALRMGFAECDYSAEEMEGKVSDVNADVLTFPSNASSEPTVKGDASSKQDDIPMDQTTGGHPDDAVGDFSQIDRQSLNWLADTLEVAIKQGAYTPAISNLKATLQPRYHTIGERLIKASETISGCPIINKLGPWLNSAIQAMPGSYDQAVKHAFSQKDSGFISQDVALAIELTLTFHRVLRSSGSAAA